ncbi:MAG: hypothetical protein Q9216_003676 [Gyalolechia sp. 2 TL-2023]
MRSVYRKFRGGPMVSGERAKTTGPDAPLQQALVLSRLPPEIRQKIWRAVLGNSLLHLTLTGNGAEEGLLRCFTCCAFYKSTGPTGEDTSFMCQGSQKEPCFFSGPAQTPLSALSLLLTSRQIYIEAVNLLYATNIFNIDTLEPLQMFIKWTGQRVQSIQTVHVNIAMWKIRCRSINQPSSAAFAEWTQFWQHIGQYFTGLLHVRLDIWGTSRKGLQETDMHPLLGLSGLKSFDLAVWRDINEHSAGQNLALSQPLQTYIRDHVCESH